MKRDLNINGTINNWIIISNPYYINDKEFYKIKCKCGKIEERSRRSIERPNFSKSCRSCSQLKRRESGDRKYKVGSIIQNLTILQIYPSKDLYKVQCICGNVYHTGHTTLSRKTHNKTSLPYCNKCFTYDKKKRKRSFMLTKNISLTIFKRLEREALRKGVLFNLTPEYLQELYDKQNHKCIYTGNEIIIHFSLCKFEDRKINTASLDRINSNKGYIKGNVQWIHKDVNYMKFNLSHDRFLELCNQITNNYVNIEPSLTSTCKEGAETTGTDTNLSDNTSKSVQHPGYFIKYTEISPLKRIQTKGELLFQDEDIVRS
jgi:hypothetical protein